MMQIRDAEYGRGNGDADVNAPKGSKRVKKSRPRPLRDEKAARAHEEYQRQKEDELRQAGEKTQEDLDREVAETKKDIEGREGQSVGEIIEKQEAKNIHHQKQLIKVLARFKELLPESADSLREFEGELKRANTDYDKEASEKALTLTAADARVLASKLKSAARRNKLDSKVADKLIGGVIRFASKQIHSRVESDANYGSKDAAADLEELRSISEEAKGGRITEERKQPEELDIEEEEIVGFTPVEAEREIAEIVDMMNKGDMPPIEADDKIKYIKAHTSEPSVVEAGTRTASTSIADGSYSESSRGTESGYGELSDEDIIEVRDDTSTGVDQETGEMELDVTDLIELKPEEEAEVTKIYNQVAAGEIEPKSATAILNKILDDLSDTSRLPDNDKTQIYHRVQEHAPQVDTGPTQAVPAEDITNEVEFPGAGDGVEARTEVAAKPESDATQVEVPEQSGDNVPELYSPEDAEKVIKYLEDIKNKKGEELYHGKKIPSDMREEYIAHIQDIERHIQEVRDNTMEIIEVTPAFEQTRTVIDNLSRATNSEQMKTAVRDMTQVYPVVESSDAQEAIAATKFDRAKALMLVDEVGEQYDPQVDSEPLYNNLWNINKSFRRGEMTREQNQQAKEKLLYAIQASTGVDLTDTRSEELLLGKPDKRYNPTLYTVERIIKQLTADIGEKQAEEKPGIVEARKQKDIKPMYVTAEMQGRIRLNQYREAKSDIETADLERNLKLRTEVIKAEELAQYVLAGKIKPELADKMLRLEEHRDFNRAGDIRKKLEVARYEEYQKAAEVAYGVLNRAGIDHKDWEQTESAISQTLARIEALRASKKTEDSDKKSGVVYLLDKLKPGKKSVREGSEIVEQSKRLTALLQKKAKMESDFWVAENGDLSETESSRLVDFGFFRAVAKSDGAYLQRDLHNRFDRIADHINEFDSGSAPVEALRKIESSLRGYSAEVEQRRQEIQRVEGVAQVVDYMRQHKGRKYKEINFSGREFLRAYRAAQSGKDMKEYYRMQDGLFKAADKMQRRTLDRLLAEGAEEKQVAKAA